MFLAVMVAMLPFAAAAHEAWLLTPDEMADLAVAPVPAIFLEFWPLAGFVGVIAVAAMVAVVLADWLRDVEEKLFQPLAARAAAFGPPLVRFGLAIMLGLGAVGGLPRHGTAMWTTPTLMTPDMQISLVGAGWAWLAYAELIVALCLLAGLATRAAALAVVFLAAMGFWAFGSPFLAYGPHFIAPALILLIYGGGALSLDRALQTLLGVPIWKVSEAWSMRAWRLIMLLLGSTFVYLGIVYKLNQPTLLIAILDHGDVPTFGLPIEMAALIMMLVEVTAGALLALGLLVRPIAVFLIGAFTFFAVTIGETPLFHANLYGAMVMMFMAGGMAPQFESTPLRALSIRRVLR
ncbi:MAG: hypothetical protein ACR2QJ_07255 [Geminicoccaceae bacterium]